MLFSQKSLVSFDRHFWPYSARSGISLWNAEFPLKVDREKNILEIEPIFSEDADLESSMSLWNFYARFSLYVKNESFLSVKNLLSFFLIR